MGSEPSDPAGQVRRAPVPAARCTTCGAWADTAHALPWITRVERVELACADHDPGGYAVDLDAEGLPRRRDAWAHLAEKRGGLRAVAALAGALARQRDRRHAEELEFDAADRGTLRIRNAGDLLAEGDGRRQAFERARGRR